MTTPPQQSEQQPRPQQPPPWQQPQMRQPEPPQPKQKQKRKWPIVVGIVGGLFMLLVFGSCAAGLASLGTSSPPASATAPPAEEEPAAPEPEPQPAEKPAPEPEPEATEAPQPEIKTHTGRGDEVIKFKKAITEPMLVVTSWSGPDGNNTIYSYDSDGNEGDLLVNTIGSYKGTNLINIYEGENVKALKIEGSGSWKITLKPISEATAWDGKGTFSGESDNVISVSDVFDGLDSMKFKSTKADSNVIVYGLGDDGEDVIVNEIGNFSGTYVVPGSVTLMKISSDGHWTMKKA
jgi:hypothetical protein